MDSALSQLTPGGPAAVLFDMDGTLVDSEKLWDEVLVELAGYYGAGLSPQAREAIVGTSMATAMELLHTDIGQPWRDPQVSAAWIDRRILDLFRGGLQWRPGAMELLAAVRRAEIPTALVTSSGRQLVEVALDTLGRESFDAVVCGDEVDATKPHPEPYLTAARLLGVPIGECVAIEDSATGVRSALAAGATVLHVPAGATVEAIEGAHLRDTLAGVDLAMLGELLTGPGSSTVSSAPRPSGRPTA